MAPHSFADAVRRHFRYLLDEYGFAVTRDLYSPEVMGNAQVILESARTGVEAVLDRGQVFLTIGPGTEPRTAWFEFTDVLRHFAPEAGEAYNFFEEERDPHARAEAQVARLAGLLRAHGGPLLRGDFSMREAIAAARDARVAGMMAEWERMGEEYRKGKGGR